MHAQSICLCWQGVIMAFQTRIQTLRRSAARYHTNVYVLYVCTFFVGFLIFGGAYQVLVNLLLIRFGYEPEFIGLLNGLGLLSISVGSVIGAVLGQRFSSIALLRGGYAFFLAGLLLFPLSNFLPVSMQRSWLLVTYCVSYLMGAIYIVHSNPLIMVSTEDRDRNTAFSYTAAIMSVGGFAGSWFAGGVSALFVSRYAISADSPLPYTWTLLAAASLSIIGVIATFYLTDRGLPQPDHRVVTSSKTDSQDQDSFPWKIILIVALVITLRIVGELAARNFVNLYLDLEYALDPSNIAYIYSVAQLVSIPAPLLAPYFMTRFGRGPVFNWATVGMASCVILMALVQHSIWVAVSYAFLLGLAQIARPAISIISMSSVKPKWRASMSSSNIIAIGLSGLATSLMGGFMIGTVGFRPFFLLAGLVTLAGVAVFWFNFLKESDAHDG